MLPWNGLIAENAPRKTVPSTSSGKSIGNQRRGRKISEGREERVRESLINWAALQRKGCKYFHAPFKVADWGGGGKGRIRIFAFTLCHTQPRARQSSALS